MGENVLNENVLVLNTTYEPINICKVKRATVLILKNIAVPLEYNSKYISSPSVKIPVPSVIKLLKYIKIPTRTVVLSRKNVLIRDDYTCQYCGKKFPPNELTIDHIIPKSKGGKTSWDNVVTCCKKCNTIKGQQTAWEAGLRLVKKPSAPNYIYFVHIVRHLGNNNSAWMKYLYK
jgi:5-methylcytosine-specific restriction endonuclease McrA